MGKLLRVRDVAEMLDVDGGTVRNWIKNQKLRAIILPRGQYRIDPSAVEELLAQIGQGLPKPEVAA